jgi:hypothetical protein
MSDDAKETGIPWLTDPQREFLAHLTVVTLLPQLQQWKPHAGYTYQRLAHAMGDLADAGELEMRADDDHIRVLVHGESIVHADRDWLEYMAPRWQAAGTASN